MGHFTRMIASAASVAVVVAIASSAPFQPTRAAGSEGGPVGTPPVDHPMPGHDGTPAGAPPSMSGHGHLDMTPADGRELVDFPPEMRMHMLRNMRDHVQTLDDVLHALANADYDGAAKVAAERLGLDSPSAAACKPKPANASAPAPGSMDEMMALYMPEPMRAIGLGMHTSASEFAVVAERAATTHDPAPAIKALSLVTENCVACHSAYRLQ
jgi:hypothetical protein